MGVVVRHGGHGHDRFTPADEAKLDGIEIGAEKNVHIQAAGAYVYNATALQHAEFLAYSDRSAETKTTGTLHWADVARIKVRRKAADMDPHAPQADLDAIDNDAFFKRTAAGGMVEVLVAYYNNDFSLNAARARVVLEPIGYADEVLDAYVYYMEGSIPSLDTAGYRFTMRLPSRIVPLAGYRAAMDVPTSAAVDAKIEDARIQEFIDDPATVRLDDYDIVQSISGANPTGEIDLTESTDDPPVLRIAITAQSKTAGDAGNNRAKLMLLGAGADLLVHNTDDEEFVFGRASAVRYLNAAGVPANALPAQYGLIELDYTLDSDRGLDAYGQLAAGAGRLHFRRAPLARNLSNLDDMPAVADLSAASKLVVKDGETGRTADVGELSQHVRPQTTEPVRISVEYSTNPVAPGDGKFNVSNAVANGAGQVNYGIPNVVDLVGGGTMSRADFLRLVNLHHRMEFSNAAGTIYIRGTLTGYADNNGVYTLNLGRVKLAGGPDDAEQQGAFVDGDDYAAEVASGLVDRKEMAKTAFRSELAGAADRYMATDGSKDGKLVTPLSTLPAPGVASKTLPRADAVRRAIGQKRLANNSAVTALTGAYVVFATSQAITPHTNASKFWLRANGIAGSIDVSASGVSLARGDVKLQRRIGAGVWADVGGGEKTYVWAANDGNPNWQWGPIEDAPATAESVEYRAALKRSGAGAHAGTSNSEFVALVVEERP